MTKLEKIELDIAALAPADVLKLAAWFEEFTAELWDRQIEEVLRAGGAAHALAPALVEAAVANSGRDNVTAVLVEVGA